MSFAAFLKGVSAKVTPSEPAALTGKLLGAAKKGKSKRRKLASFTRVLAKKSLPLAAGRRTLKLKPKKGKVGRPKKAFKVRLRVTATDAAGNSAAVTRTIRVTPPKPGRSEALRRYGISSRIVTGPSLTRATPMQAPNTPFFAPSRSQKRSYRGSAASPGAARV